MVFPYQKIIAQKKDSTSNRSRNLCFIIKTIHAGIDGLKVDTQVLKLLRILFVEHYKQTLYLFNIIIRQS